MRNNLYRATQVVPAPLLLDYALVDLASREIITPAHPGADETLVVPEVEVGFRSVLGHEYFTVLKWAHRAGIHVDIGIQLEHGNLYATSFEDSCERSRGDAFSEGRYNATCHKYILCHGCL